MSQKATAIAVVASGALIAGAMLFTTSGSGMPSVKNVSIVDGKQTVEVIAGGNYSPRLTAAKAGIPTVLEMKTMGAYDCSLALTIPAIGYRTMLPNSGTTDIEIPAQAAGTSLKGICAMGMKSFTINFD